MPEKVMVESTLFENTTFVQNPAVSESVRPEPVVSAKNLGKTYWLYPSTFRRIMGCFMPPERTGATPLKALSGLNFNVYPGEALALIGKNGAGKSTALQLLAGIIQPSEGAYTVRGRMCALLELGSGFNPEFTGRDNIAIAGALAGLTKEEISSSEQFIIEFADIGQYIDQPVKYYSSGMFLRLAFSVAIAGEPDLLIVDEALTVGDIFFRQKCYARLREMRERGMAVLLVTHSMGDVMEFCASALLLVQGRQIFLGDSKEATRKYYNSEVSSRKSSSPPLLNSPKEEAVVEAELPQNVKDWITLDGTLAFTPQEQQAYSGAYIRHFRMTDMEGECRYTFFQGERVQILQECYVSSNIGVPLAGYSIINDRGVIAHCKATSQFDVIAPGTVNANNTIIFTTEVELRLQPGEYTLSISFSHMPDDLFSKRQALQLEDIHAGIYPLSHLINFYSFMVSIPLERKPTPLSHHGIADLPGRQTIQIFQPAQK